MNRPPKDRPSTDIMPLQATDLPYSPLVFISHSSAVMLRAWDHVTWQALEMLQVPETPGHPYLDVTWNSWKWASLPRSLWALVSLPVPAAASSGHGDYRQMTGPTGQIPQLICFLSRDWKETCVCFSWHSCIFHFLERQHCMLPVGKCQDTKSDSPPAPQLLEANTNI